MSSQNGSRETSDVSITDTSPEEKMLILSLASFGSIQILVILTTILTCAKVRKKITYIFVINLLFAQLLVSTVTIPMYCFAPGHILYPYITALTIIAYILNICTVSYERYLAICRPYRYTQKVSYSKALKTSIFCWVLAAFIQLLPIFWQEHRNAFFIGRIYLGVTLLLFFIVPLTFIWLVYAFISFEIYKLGKTSHNITHVVATMEKNTDSDTTSLQLDNRSSFQRRQSYFSKLSKKFARRRSFAKPRQEFRLALVFIAAAVVSNITWVPVILMVFLQVIDRIDLEPSNISKIQMFLLVINANIDPLIYGLFLKPLRKRIFRFFFVRPYEMMAGKKLKKNKSEKHKMLL